MRYHDAGGEGTPPKMMTTSWMGRVGGIAEIAMRATDIGSGENTPIRKATVAPEEKEISTARAGTAGLPHGEILNGYR